jgi:hypothetical protein
MSDMDAARRRQSAKTAIFVAPTRRPDPRPHPDTKAHADRTCAPLAFIPVG